LDLDEIWEYIARDSFVAANRVEDDLHKEIRELLPFPGKGHTREDVQDRTLRFWKVYSYLVAYRYDDETLTVIRVIHGARNIRQCLSNS